MGRIFDGSRMTPQNRTLLLGSVVVIAAMGALNLALWLNPIVPDSSSQPGSATASAASSAGRRDGSGKARSASQGSAASGSDAAGDAADGSAGSSATASGADGESTGGSSDGASSGTAYISCDPASATDPSARADAASVPVPEADGLDAAALRSAVVAYLDGNGIGCARNIHYTATDEEVRDDEGRRVWEYACSIAGGKTDTYFRVIEAGQGSYDVQRE